MPGNSNFTPQSFIFISLLQLSIPKPHFPKSKSKINKLSVSVAIGGFLALLLLLSAAAKTVHVVGDSVGWTIPTSGDFYKIWAENEKFVVGDVLTFNFATCSHDVAKVSKASYGSCNNDSSAVADNVSLTTTGVDNVTLTTTGEHYFICSFSRHCQAGQKLAVTVVSASSMLELQPNWMPPPPQWPPLKYPRPLSSFFVPSAPRVTLSPMLPPSPTPTSQGHPSPSSAPWVFTVNRWWIWLIIGMVATITLPLICYLCFVLWRKYKAKVEREMKQQKILHEIGGNAMLSLVYGKAKRTKKLHGKASNEVEIFSFESIAIATNNFSASNKLGEGGFGPVYKRLHVSRICNERCCVNQNKCVQLWRIATRDSY